MKKFIIVGLVAALCTGLGPVANAQSAPGWGTVNHLRMSPLVTSQFDSGVVGIGQDAAGNMYVAGNFAGSLLLNSVPALCLGESDIFVAKYSATGSLRWVRKIGGTGVEVLFGFGVGPNGRCVLSGTCSGMTGGDVSFEGSPMLVGSRILGPGANGLYNGFAFMAGIDTNGSLEWSNNRYPFGAPFKEFKFDSRGNCYGSGQATENEDFSGQQSAQIGNLDALLAKLNPATGAFDWVRRVGATGGSTMATKLLVGASGALYWAFDANRTVTLDGIAAPVATVGGSCLVKLTPTNRVRWVRNNLMMSSSTVRAQSDPLAVDEAANAIYLQGVAYNNSIQFPNSSVPPYSVSAGSVGNFVAVCDTGGVAVTSIRPTALSVPTAANPSVSSMAITQLWATSNDLTYVGDTGGGSLTFLPGTRMSNANDGSICVARVENAPNRLAWVRQAGLAGSGAWRNQCSVMGAVRNAAGNIWVAGNLQGAANFGPTAIVSASNIRPDMFLAELDMAIVTGTRPQAAGVAWAVYPNPSAGAATLAGLPPEAQVRVYDAQGRLVQALGAVATATTPRTVAGLAPGLYLLQVAGTREAYQLQRLVVE